MILEAFRAIGASALEAGRVLGAGATTPAKSEMRSMTSLFDSRELERVFPQNKLGQGS